MRIAILVGACPLKCDRGPNIRLIPGRWLIEVEGAHTSVIRLHFGDESHEILPAEKREFMFLLPVTTFADFSIRGPEPFVNVRARRLKNGS